MYPGWQRQVTKQPTAQATEFVLKLLVQLSAILFVLNVLAHECVLNAIVLHVACVF